MFKKICFLSLLFFFTNIYASHDQPCIAIYPTPPECLHNEDDDNKNILIAGAIVGGVYFYLNKDKDLNSFDINNGLILFEREKVKASFLSNRFYQQSEDIYHPSAIHPFNGLEHYQNHNILSIHWGLW